MTHLSDEQIEHALFPTASLGEAAASHLANCEACQQVLAELRLLLADLAVMRESQPSPTALANYQQLFAGASAQHGLRALAARFLATLAWDSRQQPALQGVRGGAAVSYRLLFSCEQADLEVAISGRGAAAAVEGEFIQRDAGKTTRQQSGNALITLLPRDGTLEPYEAETDAGGHFRLAEVAVGRYTLLVMPATGAAIEVEDFTIA